MFDAVIKVGGSLFHGPHLPACLATLTTLAPDWRLLVLPGGGPFADTVRMADHSFNLSDSAAHWMAILAMDQYAYLLADLAQDSILVRELETAASVCAGGQLAVLAPSRLLRQQDPLPHSWQITGDSIAAWLADYAQAQALVLLKAGPGVCRPRPERNSKTRQRQVSKQSLTNHEIVDAYFARTLSNDTICWIIDGSHPERLSELFESGRTLGIEVIEGNDKTVD